MTPSSTQPAPTTAAPSAERTSADALVDAGIALSRPLDVEHLYREAAAYARHVARGSACCLAAADGDAQPRVAYTTGYDDEDATALETRLASVWREALATGRVTHVRASGGVELTAPITGVDGMTAVLTVLTDEDVEQRPEHLAEVTHALGVIAAHTAAGMERVAQLRRLEQKHRLDTIGEVVTGVARELQNPLYGISSASQLLRFRVREDPVMELNVGRILREVERLNRLVTALLEYGRPSAPRLEPGDPDAVWDAVLEGERGRLETKSLLVQRERATPAHGHAHGHAHGQVHGHAHAHTHGRWRIDAEQLAHVFRQLLENAVDAAPEASDLSLASSVLPNGSWRCRLRNAGPPLSTETAGRAFELFY